MKVAFPFALAVLTLGALSAGGQSGLPSLTNQHVDMLITYDAGASPPLALVARNDDAQPAPLSYTSNQVVLVAAEASRFTMPFDVPELGLSQGQTFWWLPQSSPPPGVLFLGVAVGGVPEGTFAGNVLRLRLTGFDGPGGFFVWQDTLGGPLVLMDSRDGIDVNDLIQALTGGHDHLNWAFTSNGVYSVTFRAEGTLSGGGTVASLETTFVFHVRPLGVVTPYALWRKAHWLQGTPDTIAGPGADPEGDELSNAIEYASNLDPTTMTVTNRPTWSLSADGGQQYGAWTFTRVRSIPDVIYNPVASDSVAGPAWEPMTNEVSVADEGDTERVTLRDDQRVDTSSHRFFQYRVQLTP